MKMRTNWGAESQGRRSSLITVVAALRFMMKAKRGDRDERGAGFFEPPFLWRGSSTQNRLAVSNANRCDAPNLAQPRREPGDGFCAANFDHERHDSLPGRVRQRRFLGFHRVILPAGATRFPRLAARSTSVASRGPLHLHAADRKLLSGAGGKDFAQRATSLLIRDM